ncbi:MAG: hypothetical protein ACKVT0_23120 [Planctomycetaceae bacterium]
MNGLVPMFLLANCTFDRTTTAGTLAFGATAFFASLVTLFLLNRAMSKLWLHFLAMAAGVFLFELFTAPMWVNQKLGRWSYVYTDVSWILTLGWTTLFLATVHLVDRYLPKWGARKRFAAYIGVLLVPVIIAEIITVQIGIRKYAPEVLMSVSGYNVAGVPIEILYYIPVFTSLVLAFYKYWSLVIDRAALIPVRKRKWVRAIGIAFLAVFLFEVLVEPVVINEGFPSWSYIYHDVTLVITGTRVLLIAVGGVLLGRFCLHWSVPQRFFLAVMTISALALPIEAWWVSRGYRAFAHAAETNFSGYETIMTGVPVEIAFAIPCYLSLIVAFIRYWEVVMDNEL